MAEVCPLVPIHTQCVTLQISQDLYVMNIDFESHTQAPVFGSGENLELSEAQSHLCILITKAESQIFFSRYHLKVTAGDPVELSSVTGARQIVNEIESQNFKLST